MEIGLRRLAGGLYMNGKGNKLLGSWFEKLDGCSMYYEKDGRKSTVPVLLIL